MRSLILRNHLSPGDICCMSASIRSLHLAHPQQFQIAVDTLAQPLYEHNPDVLPLDQAREQGFELLQMHYPLINECNQRAVHMMQGYCDYLAAELKVPVPLAVNKPVIELSPQEKTWLPQVQEVTQRMTRYWVICGGRKQDYTAKFAGTEKFQQIVDACYGKILFVQVGSSEHHHPPLKNVLNLVGKTDLRQLVRLVYHSQGTVSGITLLHHLGAALDKPGMCLLGGREPVQWNAYPKSHLFHTIGLLPCCRDGGCWKSRTVLVGDGAEQDGSLCDDPVLGGEPVPRCLSLLDAEEIAKKILLLA